MMISVRFCLISSRSACSASGVGIRRLAEACEVEADHLHNLPALIRSGCQPGFLTYDFEAERPAFSEPRHPRTSASSLCFERSSKHGSRDGG